MASIDRINYKGVVYDILEDELEKKTNFDGYYETFTSGQTEQIIATEAITDTESYIYRKTGGPNDVGDRVYDEIVGGSIVWNQFVPTNKKSGTITPTAISSLYYSSTVVAIGAIIDHVYFMRASFNYKGDKTVTGFLQAGNVPGIEYSPTLAKNTNTAFGAILKRPTGASSSFVIGINAVDHSVTLDDTDSWDYDDLYGIDLTAELTPTIANYIYSLETAHAGDGVAWFKKYFPGVYYGFCEPTFQHVQTSAKETIGFNQWDEEWELGQFRNETGEPIAATDCIRSKNFIDVLPNVAYANNGYGGTMQLFFYDADKSYIGNYWVNTTVTSPTNARYMKFRMASSYGTTYNHDICINISDPARNGEYEPYQKRTYSLEALTLRGLPKLDSAYRLYFDGDVYKHDGTVSRRINQLRLNDRLDLLREYPGKETVWAYAENFFPVDSKPKYVDASTEEWGKATYFIAVRNLLINTSAGSMCTSSANSGKNLYFTFPEGISSLADFIAWLDTHTVDIIYYVAEPTTETAEPYQYPMVVDPLGTEEFVDYGVEQGDRDVAIPVGHKSEYPADLRGKLQHLPSLASADGQYCVQQSGKQMLLVADTSPGRLNVLENKVPDPPTTEGEYKLTCSINSVGSPAFSWELVASE